jgi:decaprenyl-phosphate phosphoribosyltransferase
MCGRIECERLSRIVTRALAAGLALVKFRYHVTFVNVAFGALIFAEHLDLGLACRLLTLYVSFNVLLYSGLYTINDLADRESDTRHPLKRHRPIPSGRVSVRIAARWASVFLFSGIGSGAFFFGTPVVWCYLAIVAINLTYSLGGRNIVYLDVLLNALPHVVRFLMGALLVARRPPATHLVAFLLVAVALSCLRRLIERDVPGWEARQSLSAWSTTSLNGVLAGSLLALGVLAGGRAAAAPGVYAALVGTAFVLVGGAYWSASVRRRLRWLWTH